MEIFLYFILKVILCMFNFNLVSAVYYDDRFPIIQDCQKKNIDLILISDAASEDYPEHLQLLALVVDIFTPGEENSNRLRVAMAVSGSDAEHRPRVSWLFKLGQFSNTSEVKRAILADTERPTTSISYVNDAVEFVIETQFNELGSRGANQETSTQAVPPRPESSTNTTNSSRCHDDAGAETTEGAPLDNTSKSGLNESGSCFDNGESIGPNEPNHSEKTENTNHFTLILVLANIFQASHRNDEPDPEKFPPNTKLFMVFVSQSNRQAREDLPCSRLMWNPCIDLSFQTMLQDQSLSIALCGRCFNHWFGPMPTPEMSTYSGDLDPALAFTSCYRLAASEPGESYALSAIDRCSRLGGDLVSIESQLEQHFLETNLLPCVESRNCTAQNVIIGLRRDTNSLGKRFRWINRRPLVYSRWLQEFPLGGLIHGCVLWDILLNLWRDVGCGQLVWAPALCEWTKIVNPYRLTIPLPPPPSENSIQQALSRGELGICLLQHGYGHSVFMASFNLLRTENCHLYVNNSGRLQIVETPFDAMRIFPCEDEYQDLTLYSKVCDQVQDCSNSKDERSGLCELPVYHRKQDAFVCATSAHTVPPEARCDLYADCTDKSDEQNCESCKFGLCSDGRCVPQHWLNDGQKDCISLYTPLELDNKISVNIETDCAFLCNRSQCVAWHQLGDGVVDCLGPEGPLDETLGVLQRADCEDEHSIEWAPRCVYQKDRLGELIGCRNMRHLHGCEFFVCPEGYIKCPRAYCIPVHYLYNDDIDCPMGEDEPAWRDRPEFIPGYFKCGFRQSSVALHPDRFCDGSKDCPDGSDETGCHVTCAEGFLCTAGIIVANDFNKSQPVASLAFIDPRTRMIDLSHLDISKVFPTISQLELDYLIDLRLSNCSLSNILAPSLEFPRLSQLDLSYNLIREVTQQPDSALDVIYLNARYLRFLNLSHNSQLEVFDTGTLGRCGALESLDLSHTALTRFPEMTPVNIGLRHLNLSHTRITRLVAFTFPGGPNSWLIEVLDLRGVDIKEIEKDALNGLTITSDLNSDYFKLCCPQIRGDGIPAHTCQAPPDPFSSCFNLLENDLLRILVWVMGVASLLGNLGVIMTRLCAGRATLRLPYAQLVTQLGISDFLMGVYLIVIGCKDVEFAGEYAWHDTSWPHSALCQAAGFLSTVSSEVSSCFILLITLDRYLVIKFPFGQHRLSPCGILICSVAVWSVGLILAAVPLLPWTKHWNLYSSNAVCLGLPLLPERRAGWEFSTAVFIGFNFVLCLCIAVGQLAIYNIASSNRRAAPVSTSELTTLSRSGDLTPRMKQDVALARRLATVAFTDLMCWVPIGVLGLVALGGHSLGGEAYAWMAVFVLPVNSALNPFLYSLPVIRDHLVKAVAKCVSSTKKLRSAPGLETSTSRI